MWIGRWEGEAGLGVEGNSPEKVKGQNFQGGDMAKNMPCGFRTAGCRVQGDRVGEGKGNKAQRNRGSGQQCLVQGYLGTKGKPQRGPGIPSRLSQVWALHGINPQLLLISLNKDHGLWSRFQGRTQQK